MSFSSRMVIGYRRDQNESGWWLSSVDSFFWTLVFLKDSKLLPKTTINTIKNELAHNFLAIKGKPVTSSAVYNVSGWNTCAIKKECNSVTIRVYFWITPLAACNYLLIWIGSSFLRISIIIIILTMARNMQQWGYMPGNACSLNIKE